MDWVRRTLGGRAWRTCRSAAAAAPPWTTRSSRMIASGVAVSVAAGQRQHGRQGAGRLQLLAGPGAHRGDSRCHDQHRRAGFLFELRQLSWTYSHRAAASPPLGTPATRPPTRSAARRWPRRTLRASRRFCGRLIRAEVPPGFEPGMEVLQTSALPLGYGTESGQPGSNRRPQPWQGCALPTELCPRSRLCATAVVLLRSRAARPPNAKCSEH
jgi:hypothetical protein